jgi:hypothetical protein
LRELAKFQEE